jgi:hypothetical protein
VADSARLALAGVMDPSAAGTDETLM